MLEVSIITNINISLNFNNNIFKRSNMNMYINSKKVFR